MSATERPGPSLRQRSPRIPGQYLFDIVFAFRVDGTIGISPFQPISR